MPLFALHPRRLEYVSRSSSARRSLAPGAYLFPPAQSGALTRFTEAHTTASTPESAITELNAIPMNELPPSLRPPREEDDYDEIPIAEWG